MGQLSEDQRSLLADVGDRRPDVTGTIERLVAGERLAAPLADALRDAIGDELAATGVEKGAINHVAESSTT